MTARVAVAIEEASKKKTRGRDLSLFEKSSAKTFIKNWTHHFRVLRHDVSNFFAYKYYILQVFYRHYPAYKNKQLNVSELARVCDMSRTTVYKYIEILGR